MERNYAKLLRDYKKLRKALLEIYEVTAILETEGIVPSDRKKVKCPLCRLRHWREEL